MGLVHQSTPWSFCSLIHVIWALLSDLLFISRVLRFTLYSPFSPIYVIWLLLPDLRHVGFAFQSTLYGPTSLFYFIRILLSDLRYMELALRSVSSHLFVSPPFCLVILSLQSPRCLFRVTIVIFFFRWWLMTARSQLHVHI